MTFQIIHSGLLPERMNASMSFKRLASFFGFSSEVDSAISFAQLLQPLLEVERHQQAADGFGADLGGEAVVAVLVLRAQVFVLPVSSWFASRAA